jgi:hypothetical protein
MGDTYDSAAEAETDRVQQKASRSTQVELEPIGLTEQGQRYRVTYAGETLVEGRRNPIFDACRALLARGITGRLEVWRSGKASADMQLDIERGAGLAICETATESLRVVPWRPWRPRPDITSQDVVSRRSVQPPAAADKNLVADPSEKLAAVLAPPRAIRPPSNRERAFSFVALLRTGRWLTRGNERGAAQMRAIGS